MKIRKSNIEISDLLYLKDIWRLRGLVEIIEFPNHIAIPYNDIVKFYEMCYLPNYSFPVYNCYLAIPKKDYVNVRSE